MAHYVCTVNSPLSVEEAFDYMADLRNFAAWDPGVRSATVLDGAEPGLNTAYEVTASGAKLVYRTIEYDRPERMVAEAVTSRLRSYDIIEVAERDGGSAITYDATLELKGLFKLGEPIMKVVFNRIGDAAAGGLESALKGKLVRN